MYILSSRCFHFLVAALALCATSLLVIKRAHALVRYPYHVLMSCTVRKEFAKECFLLSRLLFASTITATCATLDLLEVETPGPIGITNAHTPHMTETKPHHQIPDQYPNQPMSKLTRLNWYMVRGSERMTCMPKVVGA